MKRKIEDYKPYKGFYDLREYNLPKRLFRRLWRVQDMLSHMNERADYFKKWHPGQWQKAQELSAHYQQLLFSHTTILKGG